MAAVHLRPRGAIPGLILALVALALALPALASAAEWTLTVNVTGKGYGEVECEIKEPDGEGGYEEYEEYCEGVGKYPNNTTIAIRPYPEEESSKFGSFENGTGSAAGCAKACKFKLTAGSSVDARFDLEEFALKIEKLGTGKGTVKCSTGGPFGPCAAKYPYESELTLLAEAEGESEFAGWSGEACEFFEEEECELEIEDAVTVTATFSLWPQLTIEKSGTGTGAVRCQAEDGPETCRARYPRETELTLLAEPAAGSEFVKWEGGCDRIDGEECELELNAATTVKAIFDPSPRPKLKLTVAKSGNGSGTVTSTPAGIDCGSGSGCEAEYEEGAEVTLNQTPALGSEFKEWTGACSDSGPCRVTMSEAEAVGAKFDTQPSGGGGGGDNGGGTGAGGGGTGGGGGAATAPGTATAAGAATVSGAKGSLKITCGGGACSGSFTLTAKVKQGKKTKNEVVGRGSFNLAAGASCTVTVKITNGQAKKLLGQGRTVKATLSGTDLQSRTVKLTPAKAKKPASARCDRFIAPQPFRDPRGG